MRPNLAAQTLQRDGGSFRDPDGFVFRQGDRVFRAVLPAAAKRWREFAASGLATELERAELMVATAEVDPTPFLAELELPAGSLVLEHERVPFISYPYEWSFDMLRDAALLELEILERCLRHGWILKDATAYNVQFLGARARFIDVLSFAPVQTGEPWAGYSQFCRLLLYPLMLEAYLHVPFQFWLRSELEGIDPAVFGRLFRGLRKLRPGVLAHVTAQAYLQQTFSGAGYSVRKEIKSAGMTTAMIARNVRSLRKLLNRMRAPATGTWTEYSRAHYGDEALVRKESFVSEVLAGRRYDLVWDLGCNDGHFSRIALPSARTVVAMDADAGAINTLYRRQVSEQQAGILPLVLNVANPSPRQGWASAERASLADRGKPDLTLALALAHHVAITANVPLAALVEWLADSSREVLIEFIAKDDPMVQRLLLNKEDTYLGYDRENFERCLQGFFLITRHAELPGGTRTMYHAVAAR